MFTPTFSHRVYSPSEVLLTLYNSDVRKPCKESTTACSRTHCLYIAFIKTKKQIVPTIIFMVTSSQSLDKTYYHSVFCMYKDHCKCIVLPNICFITTHSSIIAGQWHSPISGTGSSGCQMHMRHHAEKAYMHCQHESGHSKIDLSNSWPILASVSMCVCSYRCFCAEHKFDHTIFFQFCPVGMCSWKSTAAIARIIHKCIPVIIFACEISFFLYAHAKVL